MRGDFNDYKRSKRKIRYFAGHFAILRTYRNDTAVTRTSSGIRDYQESDLGWVEQLFV